MSDPDRELLPTAPADSVRGFLPDNEGRQLYEWAARAAAVAPILEIGSYCGRSTIWLAQAALRHNTVVMPSITTVDQKNINPERATTTPL